MLKFATTTAEPEEVMVQYNTKRLNMRQREAGFVFEVNSLYDHLGQLRDRRKAQGKVYPLAKALLMVLLAKFGGEDSLRGMADWLTERRTELADLLQLAKPRTPSRATITRLLARVVSVKSLEQVLGEFAQTLPQAKMRVVMAIDGKTLRGTINLDNPRGVQLLAAYLPREGFVLFQLEIGRRHNEIPVAAKLLKCLDLRGKIVTADALLTQRRLCLQIVRAHGEPSRSRKGLTGYVLKVKANQPQLYDDIQRLFTDPPPQPDFQKAKSQGKANGRLEVRRLTVSSMLQGYSDWPHLAQVFQLVRRAVVLKTGQVSEEITYGVTSLTKEKVTPDELLTIVRAHWGIENGLHYRRDVTLLEDHSRVRTGHAPQALAAINNLVLTLIALTGYRNARQARSHYDAHPDEAFRLVTRQPAGL
jgi:predicted transposase YbfD/YdcC